MFKVTKQKFLLLVTMGLIGYNTYSLFIVENTGIYVNKFRYCFLGLLVISYFKFRKIQNEGDFVFSGLLSLLRYIASLCLIFDGYLRYTKNTGAMHKFGLYTMILGGVVFLIQRSISNSKCKYLGNRVSKDETV